MSSEATTTMDRGAANIENKGAQTSPSTATFKVNIEGEDSPKLQDDESNFDALLHPSSTEEGTGALPSSASKNCIDANSSKIDFTDEYKEKLMSIVKAYVGRVFDEDLEKIEACGGVHAMARALLTSPESGLHVKENEEELGLRKSAFGSNILPSRRPTPFWRLLYSAASDFVLVILMAAGMVSLILALVFGKRKDIEWIEGAAIFLAVLIVVTVTAGNDWLKERQFEALCKKDEKLCSVVRDGEPTHIPVDRVVVGDVLVLETGDEVPADGIALTCRGLAMDESSMTGESDAVKKNTYAECQRQRTAAKDKDVFPSATKAGQSTHHLIESPVVLAGSSVTSGTGTLLVVAVGENSQVGQLFSKLIIDTDATPLQNKLNALARDIGNAGFFAAVLTLIVLIIEFWIIYGTNKTSERPDTTDILSSHVEFLVEAITIIVVAVPEGLPLAVTISLAFSVSRMLKDQNYVRRLAACETMGGANEICSDKTGTLTQNKMSVQAFWNGSKLVDLSTMPEGDIKTALNSNRSDDSSGDLRSLGQSSTHAIDPTVGPNTSDASPDMRSATDQEVGRSDRMNELSPVNSESKSGEQLFFRKVSKSHLQAIVENVCVNSTGYLNKEETIINVAGSPKSVETIKQVGSPTECALLEMIEALGYRPSQIRAQLGADDRILLRVPFHSDRKIMTTVVNHPERPGMSRVYVKGAAEVVLKLCAFRIDSGGRLKSLDKIHIERIEKAVVEQLACQALRTICLAYKDFNPSDKPDWEEAMGPPLQEVVSVGTERRSSLSVPAPASSNVNTDTNSKSNSSGNQQSYRWVESELICLGIAGIKDPVRPEVPAAVRRCQGAGIKVRMVTGDNLETAKQIGIQCNIYHPERGGTAMTGPEFYKQIGGVVCELCRTEICDCPTQSMALTNPNNKTKKRKKDKKTKHSSAPDSPKDDAEDTSEDDDGALDEVLAKTTDPVKSSENEGEDLEGQTPDRPKKKKAHKLRKDVIAVPTEFARIADKLEIMARSRPNDKYALVIGLRSLGSVVAVTGDGTNDAPALKSADVGFAMGIAGKDTAKQAADIVLLDDNFESIVKAVKWGRNIYDNVRRFLQFQLTVNVVAVITAFVGAVMLRESPLNAVQLLWVNLIMDTFASLALATEPPVEALLDRPPHSRHDYLVNGLMSRNIISQAVYQLTVMMTMIFTGECWIPETSTESYAAHNGDYGGFSEFSTTCGGGSTLRSGRRFHPFSHNEDYKRDWTVNIGPSRHFTVVFNTFVWLQIFNLINARKLHNEKNVFEGILRNPLWLGIMTLIITGQVLLVHFGSYALGCHLSGLTWEQWLISLSFGTGSLVVGFLTHLIPASVPIFFEVGGREEEITAGHTSIALASRGRFSSDRLSNRLAAGLRNEHFIPGSAASRRQSIIIPAPTKRSTGEMSGHLRRRSVGVVSVDRFPKMRNYASQSYLGSRTQQQQASQFASRPGMASTPNFPLRVSMDSGDVRRVA